MFTLAILLLGCQAFDSRTVPQQLIGTWETTEPRYASCTLQITEESLIFTNGIKFVEVNPIRRITRVEEGKGVLYNIEYKNKEGGEFGLSLYCIHSGKLEIIRFKHQPNIEWVRRRDAVLFGQHTGIQA